MVAADLSTACVHELEARAQTGAVDAKWTSEVQALWRGAAKSLPDACDAPIAALERSGGLAPALRWERIDKAIAAGQPGVVRAAARGFSGDERTLAETYAAYLDKADDRALQWPKTARSRLVASHGLARLAKADPGAAEALLPRVAQALAFGDAERNRVLYNIALWTVASYDPGATRRLAAVPEAAYDDRLHEWRVREARHAPTGARRWPRSRAWVHAAQDSRWSYFAARLRELTGDRAGAQPLYAAAARAPDFHGFMAADRGKLPYALCPLEHASTPSAKAAVAADPSLRRAMALYRVERAAWAEREWRAALARFNDDQRRLAVEVAQDNGWFDRGVFGLVNAAANASRTNCACTRCASPCTTTR